MPKISLIGGAYTARSVIAGAQRAVNVFPEKNAPDAESPFTHYNAPGLVALGTAPNAPGRALYWGNNDQLYYVAGNTLYSVSSTWELTSLGTIGTTSGIVSMADNGTTLVLVDNSSAGYQVSLADNTTFANISEANNSPPAGSETVYGFYGATRVDVIDGFLLFNQPGTRNFYVTYNNEVVFDSTWFAAKNGYSDNLVSVIVTNREIWLIGERTSEIWFDAGASAFPFQILPGPFVQHGCSAAYSVAQIGGVIFWLSQDQGGNLLLMRAEGYTAKNIATPAIVAEWEKYATTSDAQAFCFQVGSHPFYQLNFPSADKSWRWDESTGLWHEVAWTDSLGFSHRHRAACAAYAYGVVVAADWETGQLYQIDPDAYTDAGHPMYWRRGFPHLAMDGKQVVYPSFTLDIEAATSPDTVKQPGPFQMLSAGTPYGTPGSLGIDVGPAPVDTAPRVLLRWSDDRGRTWSQPVAQSIGATGQYLTQPVWRRLGRGRDRAFECFGVVPGRLAINGAWIDAPIKLSN